MAGGMGSRYKGLKQVEGILENGSPILEYSLYDAIRAGFTKFVFIISTAVPKSFIEKISSILDKKNLEHHWVVQNIADFVNAGYDFTERKKPWGTGHALLCAKHVVLENFLVVNADDFYGRQSFEQAAMLCESEFVNNSYYAMIAYKVENTLSSNGGVSRGLCSFNEHNFLSKIEELTNIQLLEEGIFSLQEFQKRKLQSGALVSMNFWIFNPSLFDFLEQDFLKFFNNNPNEKEEFFLPSVIDKYINIGAIAISVIASNELWKGITYPEDKIEMQDFLKEKIDQEVYPEYLWS